MSRASRHRVLILGGSEQASALARACAEAGIDGEFSYAGRVAALRPQPLPVRVGGFGGPEGLARYLTDGGFTALVDATHPFAAQMSGNAVAACASIGLPLLALERPAWTPEPGDEWQVVPDMAAAVAALAGAPERIFLAIGRLQVDLFAAQPQHSYLLRMVEAPSAPLALPQAEIVMDRGPFTVDGDRALMAARGITRLVAKNAGGGAAHAKIAAARALGLPVVMIDRPPIPDRPRVGEVAEVLRWLAHPLPAGTLPRGV
ncbi:cobalt-precorrin-6A reductase [Marinibaculum pumilum]|uniref:Cobalt-precorrin-6A reductase n=1 Tax=Marinibaculum pumilum TaxID=1766165 RepID=A0ABV7KY07_9PROT